MRTLRVFRFYNIGAGIYNLRRPPILPFSISYRIKTSTSFTCAHIPRYRAYMFYRLHHSTQLPALTVYRVYPCAPLPFFHFYRFSAPTNVINFSAPSGFYRPSYPSSFQSVDRLINQPITQTAYRGGGRSIKESGNFPENIYISRPMNQATRHRMGQ